MGRQHPEKRSEEQTAVARRPATQHRHGDAGVTDALRLQNVVPSLVYATTGPTAQPYLRGIGTRIASIGLEPSIATYIDDRYVARPYAAIFDMLDIERVEVLKGPQGTLYGRNAAGGAIRAITRDPRDRSVAIVGTIGDYDERRLELTAGGPLSGSWRGQVTGAIEQRDGFATNLVASGRASADDVDRHAFRGKLLCYMGDAVTAKLTLSWWEDRGWRGRDLVAAGFPQPNRGVALFGGITSRERDKFASALADDNRMTEAAADLRFDVALRNLDLVSITTYAKAHADQTIDVDAGSVTLLDLVAREPSDTWSQKLRLLSRGAGGVEWLAGAFLYSQDASNVYVFRDSLTAQPAFPVGTDVSNGLQEATTEAYALLNPETVDSYELGVKAQLAHDRLRVNSALFFYDFRDLQVTRGGAGAFLTTENAASADVRGLEIDADVALTRNLSLKASVALIDSKYGDYTAGALVPLTVPPYGSVPLPGGFDARGRSLLRSPDRAVYVGVHYERRLAGGARIPVSIDYSYKGDYYFDFSPVAATEWLKQHAWAW